ncbi:phosphoethanolamine transferase CptA [Synergistales bacterium]|nr:phosphoethanolamine transferase CptA [Synergistales bacterium]
MNHYLKIVLKSILLALSFVGFFYIAQVAAVQDYRIELPFLLINLTLFTMIILAALSLPGHSWLYLTLCGLLLWLPTVVVTSYIFIYKNFFNVNTFYFVWETNTAEALEFIEDCLKRFPPLPAWIALCTFAPPASAWFLMKDAREAREKISLRYRWDLFVLFSLLTVAFAWTTGVFDYNYAAQFYISNAKYRIEIRNAIHVSDTAKTQVMEEGLKPAYGQDIKETYVIVIGESAARRHWGLYGYSRPTTPLMQKRVTDGDALTFDNVNSTYTATTASLLFSLTLTDSAESKQELHYSIVDLFNGAGFNTYWFSNNAVLRRFDTLLETLSRNADTRRFSDHTDADVQSMQDDGTPDKVKGAELTDDSILLPWLRKALNDTSPKKAIFLHLKGSHARYQYRYPASFDHFKDARGIENPNVSDDLKKIDIVNAYDNSIRYTDFILDEIIRQTESAGGRAWVLYFSDHGEDVYDFNPDDYGRGTENISKYSLDVPFVIWFSEEYRRERDISRFGGYRNRPFCLDDTVHAILDIAGLKMRLYDPTIDPFSETWRMRPRVAMQHLYINIPPIEQTDTYLQEAELGYNALAEALLEMSVDITEQ